MQQMHHDQFRAQRATVHAILKNWQRFRWTLQGFGMLRLHLDDDVRIHVWDSRFKTDKVSVIHDHAQWGLTSTVLSGGLENVRYEAQSTTVPAGDERRNRYHAGLIRAGKGGGMVEALPDVVLRMRISEMLFPGMTYHQNPLEIHESIPADGTVTIMTKRPADTMDAHVYWPFGTEWVSAEPRDANYDEVHQIVESALARWKS